MKKISSLFLTILILLSLSSSLWARTPCRDLRHLINGLDEVADDISDFDSPLDWAIMDDHLAELTLFLNFISDEADDFHLDIAVDDLTDAYHDEDEDDFEDALDDVIFALRMIEDDEC